MRGTDSGPARLEDASNSQEQRTDRVPCLHFTQGTEDYARIERTPGFQSVILRKQRGTAVCRPSKNFLSHRPFTGGSFFSCMMEAGRQVADQALFSFANNRLRADCWQDTAIHALRTKKVFCISNAVICGNGK